MAFSVKETDCVPWRATPQSTQSVYFTENAIVSIASSGSTSGQTLKRSSLSISACVCVWIAQSVMVIVYRLIEVLSPISSLKCSSSNSIILLKLAELLKHSHNVLRADERTNVTFNMAEIDQSANQTRWSKELLTYDQSENFFFFFSFCVPLHAIRER